MSTNDLRNLNGPDLVKQWRNIVNDYVQMGRDAHLFKEALTRWTSAQIVLGIYRNRGERGITIPRFLRDWEDWLEEDEGWAEVCLATMVAKKTPSDFYVYLDLIDEERPEYFQMCLAAKLACKEWANGVLA